MKRVLLRLSDDRDVDVVEVGDPEGQPVVWCHGTPMGPAGVLPVDQDAAAAGLRIICPGRPGYADSSPSGPGLSGVVRDVHEVSAQLGFHRFAVVGVSGGAPFAAAVAATAHQEVVALGILVGAGPPSVMPVSDDPDDVEERRLLALAGGGERDEASDGLRGLARRWVVEATASEATPSALRGALLDGARHGYEGYVFDVFSLGSTWDVDVATVACPTRLVYGGADTSCPPEVGRWYESQIAGAHLTVLPGLGHRDGADAGRALILPHLVEAF